MSKIRRGPLPTDNFTIVSNDWVRDSRLSFRAVGVLVYLASHNEGFDTSITRLAKVHTEGRDAVDAAVRELEEFGYLVRKQGRTAEGKITASEWTLTDPDAASWKTASWKTVDGSAVYGKPATIRRPSGRRPSREDQTAIAVNARMNFDDFWATYPRREGKGAAAKAWAKAIDKRPASEIIAAAARYRDDPNRDPGFTAHPSTWLNQERWDDDPLPARNGQASPRTPMQKAEQSMRAMLGDPAGLNELEQR